MKHSIFTKSTFRQPIRTVLLLLITALAVFAFTARAAEYLLVKQETQRLGSYYRAIGQLTAAGQEDGNPVEEAVSLLENDPRVAVVDQPRYLSAVMQGVYNGDISGSQRLINTYVEGYGAMQRYDLQQKNLDFFFVGTLQGLAERSTSYGSTGVTCTFTPEEILNGAPEFIEMGRNINLQIQREDALDIAHGMTLRERYLVRARFDAVWDWSFRTVHTASVFQAFPLVEDGPMFYHVAKNGVLDWSDPALAGVQQEVQCCLDEQCALMAVTTADMSAMPSVQSGADLYLTAGRWLDGADQAARNRVCVINNGLAQQRGLQVGDTLTVTFRDMECTFGYIGYPTEWELPAYQTHTDTYEIVGLYDYAMTDLQSPLSSFYRNYAYFPDSTLPAALNAFDALRMAGDISFVLTSPALEAEFLADTQQQLAALGLQAEFLENGWSDFQAAAQPMLRASLYNLLIFALILPTALCVVAFFYFRARRRDIAIARALGVPAGVCVRQGALPLAAIGLAGVVCGTVPGWQYTLDNGAETLASLSAYGGVAAGVALPRTWLAAILGGIFLLVLLLALGGMTYLTHRPALELLQGFTPAGKKEAKAAAPGMAQTQKTAAGVPAATAAQTSAAGPLPAEKRSLGIAHTLRMVGCHIRRSRVKSALVLLLAALFTVGLAAIQLSILRSTAKVEELYSTVSVEMELVKRSTTAYVKGGFIARVTVDRVMETGYISDFYGEAECGVLNLRKGDNLSAAGGGNAWGDRPPEVPYSLRSFSDLKTFLAGNGAGIDIQYCEGWDESVFTQDWGTYQEARGGRKALPVLLPQELWDESQIAPGDRIILNVERGNNYFEPWLMEAAGFYTGAVSETSVPNFLVPAGVMNVITNGYPYYSTARFSIDPAKNRELDTLRDELEEITGSDLKSRVSLRALLWDEELRNAIGPLENSIQLMEVLYPVVLVLSLLAALGVSALLILTEAREAAIMRVLGTTKFRSRLVLVLQIVFVVLAGLLFGLAGAALWSGSAGLTGAVMDTSTLRAAAYLLCAAAGSVAGAVSVTNRPPLELLQVKE